jgi:acyl-coenzyme A thioesterase PaaI-like protein
MSDPATSGRSSTFIGDLSFSHRFEGDRASGWAEFTDELRVPATGQARISVLATLGDIFTGTLAAHVTAPKVALTIDLSLRIVGDVSADRLDATSAILRTGRTITLAGTDFTDPAGGAVVAVCTATFMPSPRPQDVIDAVKGFTPSRRRMGGPFPEEMGARVLAPGHVEMARQPYVQQPTGVIQGGALALLAEVAGETLLDAPVAEMELRYLRGLRVGPARTRTERLGDDTARIEVIDTGDDDRLTTVIFARSRR